MARDVYRVTAPVVICKAMTRDGIRYVHIQHGGTVPEEADPQWIEGHLHGGMIAKVASAPDPEPPPPAEPPPAEHRTGRTPRSQAGE